LLDSILQINLIRIFRALLFQESQDFILFKGTGTTHTILYIGGPGYAFGQREKLPFPGGNIDIDTGYKQDFLALIFLLPDDSAEGTIEFRLGIDLGGNQQRLGRGYNPRHGVQQILLQMTAPFDITFNGTPEPEQIRAEIMTDS